MSNWNFTGHKLHPLLSSFHLGPPRRILLHLLTPISGPVLKINFHPLFLAALLVMPGAEEPSHMEMCLHCGSSGGLGHPFRVQASRAV